MEKVNLSNIKLYWQECNWGSCILRVDATLIEWPYPVAYAIIHQTGLENGKQLANLLYTWVEPKLRRQGIMSLIHKEIEETIKPGFIVTGVASSLGKKLAIKLNYVNHDDLWIKEIKKAT